MRILDERGEEIPEAEADPERGYLVADKVLAAHHAAQEAVEEEGHYELLAFYPATGGCDVEWVVDAEGREAVPAWDEYEDVLRYVPYTEAQMRERECLELEARLSETTDAVLEVAEGLSSWDDHPGVREERARIRKRLKKLRG